MYKIVLKTAQGFKDSCSMLPIGENGVLSNFH